jgi:hypothetical protein
MSFPDNLLFYKPWMSSLARIIRRALKDLYNLRDDIELSHIELPPTDKRLHDLVKNVTVLESSLQQWRASTPPILMLDRTMQSNFGYGSIEAMRADIGAHGTMFNQHILQMQALALAFTYENARLLIHRPLLSYKQTKATTRKPPNWVNGPQRNSTDPLQLSSQACRDAAIKISELGTLPAFKLATETYAAAFLGPYVFTAGVALCLITSIDPFHEQSLESKRALRRLMDMSRRLEARSDPAFQGLKVLQELVRLIYAKELSQVLSSEEMAYTDSLSSDNTSTTGAGADTVLESIEGQFMSASLGSGGQGAFQSFENGDLLDFASFDIYEDPIMAEALQEIDQGMTRANSNQREILQRLINP